ncbi:phosphotransferase [Rhodospirillaceae bacterium KN72]|uniref:Phosphotransferase n=1 Tax=Pacificispira spongiicola TaxID=2729598 RepID=A0A7Y0HEJ2_9PROT|nr:phosphotransferase [Pacificispira spongiicola]NMM43628.1 phosphotransferase [Pacificispira spongiicola]
MAQTELAHDDLLGRLHDLANASLGLWPVPEDAAARLINISENATYLVEGGGGYRSILRVHREDYHTERAIECELMWMDALNEGACVVTPAVIPGRDGHAVQKAGLPGRLGDRFMVMFEFVEGDQPDESQDLVGPFEELGEIAAKTHNQSIAWRRPSDFERLVWDLDAIYGPNATWGDWRKGPKVEGEIRNVLERVESTVADRLSRFGKSDQRYGLIHADMRLANLLIDKGTTRLIDFDDCGFGWYLYDFAAGISFIEDDPQIPAMRDAWVRGYRKHRAMSVEEEREIDSFIMLRRMALLAWIGSHSNVPEAQALAADFARVSAELGERYLSRMA